MSQTSVNEQVAGFAGVKYALLKGNVLSLASQERIPFGRFVALGDSGEKCKLPSLAADITSLVKKRGVALHQHTIENAQDGLEPGYPSQHPVSVMDEGGVFVEVEEAVAEGDDVFVRYAGKKQVQTIVFDADIVTSNTINGKVGEFEIAEVTFDTDHATTMQLIADAILAANLFIESAAVGGAGNRTITITTALDSADQDASDFVVAAGASQAGVVESESDASVNSTDRGLYRTDADSSSAAQLAGARWLRASESMDGKLIAVLQLGVA